jgi:glucose-1-phosphate cytidylyltransferase
MKVVLLAGGLGTRLSEETDIKPKPMVEIGGKPILWHIMKHFSHYGFNDFVICCGYKGYLIKEYFVNYYLHHSDISISLKENNFEIINSNIEPWKITLVDTGLTTMTGGRIKRIQKYIGNNNFLLTYGDGLADVNIHKLVDFHIKSEKYCTVTSVQPKGRFGALNLDIDQKKVVSFVEKPKGDNNWINGGFLVCKPDIFQFIIDDDTIWEKEPMEKIASLGEMVAFKHEGFWKPMDTLRDKHELESEWQSGNARWKTW